MARRWHRDARRRTAFGLALGVVTFACVVGAAWTVPEPFQRLSGLVFDLYQQLRPRQDASGAVAVVDIDEASLNARGQWPWPRSDLARLVHRLGELGAATIAFDMLFSEPDRTSLRQAAESLRAAGAEVRLPEALPDNDELLAAAFARNRVTAGFALSDFVEATPPPPKAGFAFAGDDPSLYLFSFRGGIANLPVLNEAAAGLGSLTFPPNADGIARMVPLVARGAGQLYPTLAVEALRVAQGAGSVIIRATGASGEANTGRPAMTALKVGALEAPTGPRGEFRIYFSGLPQVPLISAARLFDDAALPDLAKEISGRIVLVGSSALGLRDQVATPLSPVVAGVLVHAEIIDQILAGSFLTRPDWAPGAEAAGAALLTAILLAGLLLVGPLLGAGLALLLMSAAAAASWLAFAQGALIFDPILPGLSVLAVYVAVTALLLLLTDRERQFVRRAFAHYLAPALVERLADDPSALSLGGENRELTVLFSDIRGFTTLSENLDPHSLTRLLNRFLTPMTDVLLASGATIDKYIGDAVMAFWNAPLATPDHPRHACLAALAMLDALKDLNRDEGPELKIGIGLNTGLCCVGNLGSERRFSYSAIGDAVNVAARAESLTKLYGVSVLLTEHTARHVRDMALLELDLVRVAGRNEPLAVFALLGDACRATGADFQALSAVHGLFIEAYRSGDLSAAAQCLDQLGRLGFDELRTLHALYAERLAHLEARPPSGAWDGVYSHVKEPA
jgi:adenylate cyclase